MLWRFFFVISALLSGSLHAALIIRPAEIILRIEDADFKQKIVTAVSFADQEIDIGKSGIQDFRKEEKFKLMPGVYLLKWTTQIGDVSWVAKEEKTHEFIIEIEKKDQLVRMRIRGDNLSLY